MGDFFMQNNHLLTINDKKRVDITSVSEVLAFSDKEIKLKLVDKTTLLISGNNLKISVFDNNSGNATLHGDISLIKYKGKDDTFIKKVFK